MNDIIPPKRKTVAKKKTVVVDSAVPKVENTKPTAVSKKVTPKPERIPDIPETMDIGNLSVGERALEVPKSGRVKSIIAGVITTLVLLTVTVAAGAFFWYQEQLKPVDEANKGNVKVAVVSGMGPEDIGALLKKNNLIKSQLGFDWYLRVTQSAGKLQAGTYSLSQSMSLPDIIGYLKSGKTETLRITFLPGATIADNMKVLSKAGFSKDKIETAFAKSYDHRVFKSKPASADLEGYIYGETYEFNIDVTVEDILKRSFDELEAVIEKSNLESGYNKQGLSLYEGITLSSIVQREVSGMVDQRMVAQVFYNRLKTDMNLGSDVTYQYIADKEGRERDPNLDSPYNTRRNSGLPPGPIASPGRDALFAVARPLSNDYRFFLSGDDDVTYYGRSDAEHQRNIEEHCKKKCQIL